MLAGAERDGPFVHEEDLHLTYRTRPPIGMTFRLRSTKERENYGTKLGRERAIKYPSTFVLCGETDNDVNVLPPHNLPEILKSRWQWCLSSNIPPPSQSNMNITPIKVIISTALVHINPARNLDPIPLKRPNIRIPILLSTLHGSPNRKPPVHLLSPTQQDLFKSCLFGQFNRLPPTRKDLRSIGPVSQTAKPGRETGLAGQGKR